MQSLNDGLLGPIKIRGRQPCHRWRFGGWGGGGKVGHWESWSSAWKLLGWREQAQGNIRWQGERGYRGCFHCIRGLVKSHWIHPTNVDGANKTILRRFFRGHLFCLHAKFQVSYSTPSRFVKKMTYFCIIFAEKYFPAKYLRFYTSTKNFIKIRPKMSKRQPIKKKNFFLPITPLNL